MTPGGSRASAVRTASDAVAGIAVDKAEADITASTEGETVGGTRPVEIVPAEESCKNAHVPAANCGHEAPLRQGLVGFAFDFAFDFGFDLGARKSDAAAAVAAAAGGACVVTGSSASHADTSTCAIGAWATAAANCAM